MIIDPTLYTDGQLEEIYQGKSVGLDISLFANPEYNEFQMFEIRQGMVAEQDVSKFAYVNCPSNSMNMLRWCMDIDIEPDLFREAFIGMRDIRQMRYLTRMAENVRDKYKL